MRTNINCGAIFFNTSMKRTDTYESRKVIDRRLHVRLLGIDHHAHVLLVRSLARMRTNTANLNENGHETVNGTIAKQKTKQIPSARRGRRSNRVARGKDPSASSPVCTTNRQQTYARTKVRRRESIIENVTSDIQTATKSRNVRKRGETTCGRFNHRFFFKQQKTQYFFVQQRQ